MALLSNCPSCGLASDETRCPRCNALKVVGCTGSCSACKSDDNSTCKVSGAIKRAPSEEAREDEEHPGTPLER